MESALTIGLDVGKSVFQVHGVDAGGAVVIRRRLTGGKLLGFFAKQPACLVGMEACAAAHHWGRELHYSVIVTCKGAVAARRRLIDDFLAVFGGATQPIMTHLIESVQIRKALPFRAKRFPIIIRNNCGAVRDKPIAATQVWQSLNP